MSIIEFGRRLRDLRLQHNLSQDDLASKLEIDKSYISKLENGKVDYPPKLWVFERVSAIFDVPASKLMLLCGLVPNEVIESIGSDLSNAILKSE